MMSGFDDWHQDALVALYAALGSQLKFAERHSVAVVTTVVKATTAHACAAARSRPRRQESIAGRPLALFETPQESKIHHQAAPRHSFR